MIEIIASDGQFQVSESFKIILNPDISDLGSSNMNSPELSCYPNPFSDYIYLEFRNDHHYGKLQCSVHSLSGKTLIVEEFVKEKVDFNVKLNLNSLEKGSYILHVTLNGQIIASKVITNWSGLLDQD
jgi:hypothetical protein